jgi:hypothetical protein
MKPTLSILSSRTHSKIYFCVSSLTLLFSFLTLSTNLQAADKKEPSSAVKTIKKAAETIQKPIKELKKVTQPVEEALTKTAETAAQEVKEMVKEAHGLGRKLLQSLINIMTAASPGKTRVYLPAPSSDPNSGVTVGILPVFLFVDTKEQIEHILAPSLTYNRLFKLNSTLRYYWYPRPEAQLFVIGSYSLETNRRFTLRYEDPHFFADWFYFKFDYTLNHDGSSRFFGFGADSKTGNQTNYNLKDNHTQIFAGINFLEYGRFTLWHRFRFTNAVDGPITSLPGISTFNPLPTGVDDPKQFLVQGFALSYDSRDFPKAPIRGYFVNLFTELSGYLGSDADYERLGTEARGFHPTLSQHFITGWRVFFEGENGANTPFYEQSLLGGKNSLRGFGAGRFVDRYKAGVSLEERICFYTLKAFNVNIEFEVTPFYEAGTVFRTPDKLQGSKLHHVGGVGFRSIVKPNVVGIIDLGFSEDGSALFVGIDYPF